MCSHFITTATCRSAVYSGELPSLQGTLFCDDNHASCMSLPRNTLFVFTPQPVLAQRHASVFAERDPPRPAPHTGRRSREKAGRLRSEWVLSTVHDKSQIQYVLLCALLHGVPCVLCGSSNSEATDFEASSARRRCGNRIAFLGSNRAS